MAYSRQVFNVGSAALHTQLNQLETNIAEHVHGTLGVPNGTVADKL